MKFLKNFWKLLPFSRVSVTNRSPIAGIDLDACEFSMQDAQIVIRNYPFEPATVYPEQEIHFEKIDAVHLQVHPPTIRLGRELIFIARTEVARLESFAQSHHLQITNRPANWTWLTEPFLDTFFDENQKKRTHERLAENGFSLNEIKTIRKEIETPLLKYNFDSMLWEWQELGLYDVLAALRATMKKEAFRDFYWRAMEIEQRTRL